MPEAYFRALQEGAERTPDRLFFRLHGVDAGVFTFARMLQSIEAGAASLAARHVEPGDIVLIFAQHSLGMLQAFFGAQRLLAVPAFLPPPTSRQPLSGWVEGHRALIARIDPALIVCEDRFLPHIRELGDVETVTTSDLEAFSGDRGALPTLQAEPGRIAFLQHSSGTTGLKKGVTVTYGQLAAQLRGYSRALGIDPEQDCIVSWLPLYHDMGLIAATLLPFRLGVPVDIIETFEWLAQPARYIDLLRARPRSFSWLPNFALTFLAQRVDPPPPEALAHVRAIINCSEPCKADAMNAFIERFSPAGLPSDAVQVCYAMAEYVFAVTQTETGKAPHVLSVKSDPLEARQEVELADGESRDRQQRFVSVGRPIQDTEIRIGDAEASVENRVGEIRVRGSSACSGYYANPEMTQNKFKDGWYHTGDLGFVHNGELYVTGRSDDLIIIRGRNIYAHDLEALVSEVENVKRGRTVAFGIFDDVLGTEKLIIAAELNHPNLPLPASRLIRSRVLEVYGVSPADIVVTGPDTLIKTTSGKMSRSENQKRYVAGTLERWDASGRETNDERARSG
ncbi:MAG: AMP-binding protein [Rhizobiales bacterium]|nr:AMP-binding protein [Hyphomicrobiales bacterium]